MCKNSSKGISKSWQTKKYIYGKVEVQEKEKGHIKNLQLQLQEGTTAEGAAREDDLTTAVLLQEATYLAIQKTRQTG
jgi:hypothetical protein